MANRPPRAGSSSAAKALGPEKCGRQSQSIDPARETSAAVLQSPMSA
jgi:hypothetical protein